ncbi:RNA pyrophosphohydrolase [Candidatus Pacearchaeota archaeon CG_4_9_14_0_2_um_filter_39_13]|nr:MAG: RNA pyrophosphohydrolase [Candidatus Pacearchaeota archaeon CG_4_9_14_0_2_um_filter_39_13]
MKKGVDFTGVTTVFCCHDGKGNILMHVRSKNCRDEQGNWDWGSGSLDYGLSPEENLRKEVMEEYGVDVKELKLLGNRNVKRSLADGTPTHWISFDYLCLVDRDKVKNGEPESIDEPGWFTLDSLPEPLHSQIPSFLELYKDKLDEHLKF